MIGDACVECPAKCTKCFNNECEVCEDEWFIDSNRLCT
jgi:hypothetical protein